MPYFPYSGVVITKYGWYSNPESDFQTISSPQQFTSSKISKDSGGRNHRISFSAILQAGRLTEQVAARPSLPWPFTTYHNNFCHLSCVSLFPQARRAPLHVISLFRHTNQTTFTFKLRGLLNLTWTLIGDIAIHLGLITSALLPSRRPRAFPSSTLCVNFLSFINLSVITDHAFS